MAGQKVSFYWHDYETWGLSPSLDRPSQFAGIRTDQDFNVIDEPDMFYCRLSDDYLPNLVPALITGITPEVTQTEGFYEVEFAKKIYQNFTQPNTCVVGYNTIRFDEEFTRHLFYRNFLDSYEYTWKYNNSRWDIIDLVRAAYALRPEGIEWPRNEDGLPSFRLELLTEANGISHEQAHDATSDVYATIAIAKLIKEKCPRLFNYYFELRDKNKVKALIDTDKRTPLVHVSGMFGAKKANISLVAPVAWHPINKNAVIVVDLSQDISPIFECSSEEIRDRLYTKHDELGENLPIPLKLIHINKCPFIAIEKTLLPENAERVGIDRQKCLDRLQNLKSSSRVTRIITEVFNQEREFDHKQNVDRMLYVGFFTDNDKREFERIRKTKPEKLSGLKLSVTDKRFNDLFFNYRARNFIQTLTTAEKNRWKKHCQSILDKQLTEYISNLESYFQQYKDDIDKMRILNSISDYVRSITK